MLLYCVTNRIGGSRLKNVLGDDALSQGKESNAYGLVVADQAGHQPMLAVRPNSGYLRILAMYV